MRLCQIVLTGCLLAGTASAGIEEWTSIDPAGPASDIGGNIIALGYADTGEAYLLSGLGRLHKRTAIDQPWVPLPVMVDGNAVRLTALSIGPGNPASLVGQVGFDRLVRSADDRSRAVLTGHGSADGDCHFQLRPRFGSDGAW